MASFSLINCANNDAVEKPTAVNINQAQGVAKTNSSVEFFDSAVFDEKLGEALTANSSVVEVKTISPMNVNQIPKRLDVWMSAAVHEYGGKVETKPDPAYPQSKAIIGEVIDLVISIYDAVKKETTYGAAENYNLTVYYKPGTGTVTKMVFTHK